MESSRMMPDIDTCSFFDGLIRFLDFLHIDELFALLVEDTKRKGLLTYLIVIILTLAIRRAILLGDVRIWRKVRHG